MEVQQSTTNIFDKHPELLDGHFVATYDFDDCFTVLNPTSPFDPKDVALALLRSEGNMSVGAKFLGRSRRHFEGFVLRNTELAALLDDIEQTFLDEVEFAHRNAAKQGDLGTQRFFLTTKGKERGFNTRTEMTGKNGDPMEVEIGDARSILSDRINRLLAARTPAGNDKPDDGLGG